jgi:hypothetical protein
MGAGGELDVVVTAVLAVVAVVEAPPDPPEEQADSADSPTRAARRRYDLDIGPPKVMASSCEAFSVRAWVP